MKKTGAQIITKLLEMHGIETAAGIPGGSILPLFLPEAFNHTKIVKVWERKVILK